MTWEFDDEQVRIAARVCHEAMRAYRAALGDSPLPAWDEAEEWQVNSTIAAVRFRLANPDAPPGAQHTQWMEEKHETGWRYGKARDDTRKLHPMMVPFEALPENEKRKDLLIQKIVDAISTDMKLEKEMPRRPTSTSARRVTGKYFISYSSIDKTFARRVAFTLRAWGESVWFDDTELEEGAELTERIKNAIEHSKTVVIIASKNSAKSDWVKKEIEFASQVAPKFRPRIVTLFKEDVTNTPLFEDIKGFHVQDRFIFQEQLARVAGRTYPVEEIDIEAVRTGLSHIRTVSPHLAPLCDTALTGANTNFSQIDNILRESIDIDDLEYCLEAGWSLSTQRHSAVFPALASEAFVTRGAGMEVLKRVSRPPFRDKNSDPPLARIITPDLGDARLPDTLRLLGHATPPDDQALFHAISRLFDRYSVDQRAELLRLLTHPERGPQGFTLDAATLLYARMPDNEALRALWYFWIRDGDLEGGEHRKNVIDRFFHLLVTELSLRLELWEPLRKAINERVSILARHKERSSVEMIVSYVTSAADAGYPFLADLVNVARRHVSDLEGWQHSQEMLRYLEAFADEALTDQDWAKAIRNYERTWGAFQKFSETRNRLRKKDPPE